MSCTPPPPLLLFFPLSQIFSCSLSKPLSFISLLSVSSSFLSFTPFLHPSPSFPPPHTHSFHGPFSDESVWHDTSARDLYCSHRSVRNVADHPPAVRRHPLHLPRNKDIHNPDPHLDRTGGAHCGYTCCYVCCYCCLFIFVVLFMVVAVVIVTHLLLFLLLLT